MASFPWLPLDIAVNESVRSNKVLSEGDHYQILDTKKGDKAILLINAAAPWLSKAGKGKSQKDILVEASIISAYSFNDEDYWIYVTDKKTKPIS